VFRVYKCNEYFSSVGSEENKKSQKKLTPDLALEKIKNWCAYQERSQQETRDKLYEYGLHKEDVEQIITDLISENFLNEERYAIAFAGGKFRIKKWGKQKIKAELRMRKVSDYCIHKALGQISDNDYISALESVIVKRLKQEKESNKIKRHYKILQYASSRGYEKDLIVEVLNELADTSPYKLNQQDES
jgi:regulatory protein